MFSKLGRLFVKRKIKKLIHRATNIIYSEESVLIKYLERDLIVGKKPFNLLCAYIAIRVAADATMPFDKSDIENALQELYSSKLEYQNHEEYEAIVGMLKAKAEASLLKAEIEILIGKTAYDANKYSYEGIMYSVAKAKKGPLSFEDRKQLSKISTEIIEAECKLEEHLAQTVEPDYQEQATESQIKEEIDHLKSELKLLEDPATINSFGQMSFDGDGGPKDYVEAANWFRIAAEQGYAKAQHNLALMYEYGQGVYQDYAEAAKWYHMAAEQGFAASQNNLGCLCETGNGVMQNHADAIKWYRIAAENGDVNALSNLNRLEADN